MQRSGPPHDSRTIRALAALLLSLTGLLAILAWIETDKTARAAPLSPSSGHRVSGVRVLSSGEEGIVLELYTPEFETMTQTDDQGLCQAVSVDGYATTDEAGWPTLPVYGTLAGVPPDRDLTLTVLEVDRATVALDHPPCPSPRLVHALDPAGQLVHQGVALTRDPAAYAANRAYPAAVAELGSVGFVRSQRVAQLRFHPIRYNPASMELDHVTRIRVRLDFGPDDARPRTAGIADDEGTFEGLLQETLVNYDGARAWRVPPAATTDQTLQVDAASSSPTIRIAVDADAIYQVTYADLEATGMDVGGVDPRTFQLHTRGQNVAIEVTGEADGSFDPGDAIIFYGEKTDTKYTDINIYWLTWNEGAGSRMPAVDGTPDGTVSTPPHFATSQRVEENNQYRSYYPSGPEADRWFWNTLQVSTETVRNYHTTLENVASTPLSATVRGLFQGYYARPGDQHTRVYLNSHLVDDAIWSARAEHTFETMIPQSVLNEGANTFSIEFPFDQGNFLEIIFVNRFEIVYHRTYVAQTSQTSFAGDNAGTWEYQITGFPTGTLEVFDVTSPTLPARILSATVGGSGPYTLSFQHTISGSHRYVALAPADRATPLSIEPYTRTDAISAPGGADYVIISHGDFLTAVQPLADHRAAEGLRTVVVDVADIYDAFNHGVFHPEAIRDFLTHAYETWDPPAPSYVLLVGDGNYDFKDYLGTGEPSYVPPYLADVDPWLGEVAADNRYVCVSGDDVLPDMHLGRLAIKSPAEAEIVVGKILSYEQDPSPGNWNRRLLFVADDADGAGDFDDLSNDLIESRVPAGLNAERVHLGVTHPNPWPYNPPLLARQAVTEAINQGQLLVSYIGHGDRQIWASEGLLRYDDLATFTNTRRLPLVVPMTCKEGYYVEPSPQGTDRSAIGEGIVRATGGAIASWSPGGEGVATGHTYLNRGLFQALFWDRTTQLGPATLQGKLELYATGGSRELIDTYLLFGDPALNLNLPYMTFLPLSLRQS